MSRILITGANGFIGQHLCRELLHSKVHQVIATGKGKSQLPFAENETYRYHTLDITEANQVESLFTSQQPGVVIHAAALGQPDFCEKNEDECRSTNIAGTENITASCKKINAFLVFLSTDFVFDGTKGPYHEEDQENPVNRYGQSKLAGELHIKNSGIHHAILRLCSVYGIPLSGTARNIITWLRENLENGKPIQAVDDQVRTPSYIGDVISAIITLADRKMEGIFHISGDETLTPYQMAMATADYLHFNTGLITRVNSGELNQPAQRPLVTGFITKKAKNAFGFNPKKFSEALNLMFPS
ncbi:MAG: SDR family oxidoreductase [Ginsengibacter sp.]